jgi:hypothetical protein
MPNRDEGDLVPKKQPDGTIKLVPWSSSAQMQTAWLTFRLHIGRTLTYVPLPKAPKGRRKADLYTEAAPWRSPRPALAARAG